MTTPEITLHYLGALGVVYAALALAVVIIRGKNHIPYGDGGNTTLLRAIRAHGNFAEWVPIVSLLVAGLEMTGQPSAHIHWMMGALVTARTLHPIGLFSPVGTPVYFVGRISGAFLTWVILGVASFLALQR